MNLTRIWAIILRHLYLYQRSLPRLIEIFYWPLLDLILWGFITIYISQVPGEAARLASFFLAALLLYDVFLRSTLGVSVSYLEEPWTRNLMNLFVTPLTTREYLAGIISISLFKTIVSAGVTALLAYLLYAFNILTVGPALIPFIFALLLFGWVVGIIATAIILRFGLAAEVLAWGLAFLFQPLSAVYYPVTVLPVWLQKVTLFVPTSHIFEGMREVILTGQLSYERLVWAFGLGIVYLFAAIALFAWVFKAARRRGLLMRME